MAQETHQEIQNKWVECERSWNRINRAMRDIDLPEFGTPDDFVDLHDIVKLHAEQDSSWVVDIEKVANMAPSQVKKFMEHTIKAWTMLQELSAKVIKYLARAMEIKEILSALMDQHRFTYTKTCEEIFVKWSNYEKIHPLK
jgi:hypothetical protein